MDYLQKSIEYDVEKVKKMSNGDWHCWYDCVAECLALELVLVSGTGQQTCRNRDLLLLACF